jgi:hypothetical protein
VTSKPFSVSRSFITVVLSFSCFSCDPGFPPILCNGFQETIFVNATWQGGNRSGTATIRSQECGALSVISTHAEAIKTETLPKQDSLAVVTVSSRQNEVLGTYHGSMDKILMTGLGHSPRWLITDDGLFHIPQELDATWEGNIDLVKAKADVAFSNSASSKN